MKTVYIDMDDVICDFQASFAVQLKENPDIRYPQSQYGFFANLVPIAGAIEAVNTIRRSDSYETYILTAPSTRNPFSYLEKRVWIETHFDYELVKRLILCPNKGLMKGDILIDDNISGKGQESFEGQLIHFGSVQYPDWAKVLLALGLH